MPSFKPLIRLVVLNALWAMLLSSAAEAATYTLSWSANTETDVNGYVLSWGTQSGGPYSTGSQAIAGKATTTTSVANLDPAVTYYFVLQAKNNAGVLSGNSAEVSTAVAPSITSQPASQAIGSGATATMNVTATSTASLTYQWYVGVSGSTASPIGGATSSSYTTPPLTATTSYWVRVSNAAGTADSTAATITVGAMQITSQPANQMIRFGVPAMFSVAASLPAPSFQWQISTNGGVTWSNLPDGWPYSGVTTTTLTVSGAMPAVNDARYRCVVTSLAGSATSNAATLTVMLGTSHSDFDGDRKADLAVYRPSTGTWYVDESSTGFSTYLARTWGFSTDIPVPGDFDGDGKTDIAVYRPSTGTWWILLSSTNFTSSFTRTWGLSTDVPVHGDFDGDGKTDIAVYRPSTGTWWILLSSTNFTSSFTRTWGFSTDIPVPGDYDGDGKTDIAIYRPSTGTWWILLSSTNFTSSFTPTWGYSTDIPVPGDYDGDGKTDIAIYHPSNGTWWILLSSTNFTSSFTQTWGYSTDIPVPGDYDGDGKADIAIYRPSTGTWWVLQSSTNFTSYFAQMFGLSTDVP